MGDLERLKCGGFLTEVYTVGSGFDDMFEMLDLADQHKQSWHGWSYQSPLRKRFVEASLDKISVFIVVYILLGSRKVKG